MFGYHRIARAVMFLGQQQAETNRHMETLISLFDGVRSDINDRADKVTSELTDIASELEEISRKIAPHSYDALGWDETCKWTPPRQKFTGRSLSSEFYGLRQAIDKINARLDDINASVSETDEHGRVIPFAKRNL